MPHDDLLCVPLDELMAAARRTRDEAQGKIVSYSPKVFIPLTMLCRDKCGYCTFAQPPARLDHPYLGSEQVLEIARRGAAAGCHEALFTLGERPERRYPAAREWLLRHGYESTVDYVVAMAQLVLESTGLLPHANSVPCTPIMAKLRRVAPSQGMMVETLRDDVECDRGAADKDPQRRLPTLERAGNCVSPTHGILVGSAARQTGSLPWRRSLRPTFASDMSKGDRPELCPRRAPPCSGPSRALPRPISRRSRWLA